MKTISEYQIIILFPAKRFPNPKAWFSYVVRVPDYLKLLFPYSRGGGGRGDSYGFLWGSSYGIDFVQVKRPVKHDTHCLLNCLRCVMEIEMSSILPLGLMALWDICWTTTVIPYWQFSWHRFNNVLCLASPIVADVWEPGLSACHE